MSVKSMKSMVWTNEKLPLMVAWLSVSCFKVQSSIGHLVWFFDSRNSIVSGGNSCCPNRTYYAKCPDSPLKIFPFKKNNLFIISQKFQLWIWFDNCAVVGWVSEVPLSSMPRVGMEQRRTLDFNKSRLSTFYQASQTTRFSGNADTVLSSPGIGHICHNRHNRRRCTFFELVYFLV